MKALSKHWQQLLQFLLHDLWDVDPSGQTGLRRLALRALRVTFLVIKGFREDALLIHASALSFATVLSMIPALAILFSILSTVGFGEEQIAKLLEWQKSMPEQFQEFMGKLIGIAQETNFAALGVIGLIALLMLATSVLSNMETTFNLVWGVRKGRTYFKRLMNHVSIIVVVPVLIGLAMTLSATLSSPAVLERIGSASKFYHLGLKASPFLAGWLGFAFLYIVLPNTRVPWKPALISGLFSSLAWLFWQTAYIEFQVGVARRNAIYGTFASIPIFLGWLYIGWVLVIVGAELCFALQNESTYHLERAAQRASLKSRVTVGLSLVVRAAQALAEGRGILDLGAFAHEYNVPIRLLNDVAEQLCDAGYLAPLADQEGALALLCDPRKTTVKNIYDTIAEHGLPPEELGMANIYPKVDEALARIDSSLAVAFDGHSIYELITDEDTV